MLTIMTLNNGKNVYIDGSEIKVEDALEIIAVLTKTWGNDFQKQELKELLIDTALGIVEK